MRDRDLVAEARVMAIGVWTRIFGLLAIVGAAWLLALSTYPSRAAVVLGPVIVAGAWGVLLGSHLFDLRPWARWGFLATAVLNLLLLGAQVASAPVTANLVGAALGGGWCVAQLWALFGASGSYVFSPGYGRARSEDRRSVDYYGSVFFVVPAVCTVLVLLSVAVRVTT